MDRCERTSAEKNEALQVAINANWLKDYEFENEEFSNMEKNMNRRDFTWNDVLKRVFFLKK